MNNIDFNKIFQYVVMGLLATIGISILVILIFLSKYSGDKIPTYYFYIIILGLLIIGFGLFKLLGFLDKKMFKNVKTVNIMDIDNWERIKIKSTDIQVISSPFYQEVPKSSNWRIQGLDSLSNDGGVKRERIDRIYLKYDSKNKTYKQLIGDKDEISLKMILSKMDYIDLCINQKDKNEYYFDLQI
jgi:hypothetical protein